MVDLDLLRNDLPLRIETRTVHQMNRVAFEHDGVKSSARVSGCACGLCSVNPRTEFDASCPSWAWSAHGKSVRLGNVFRSLALEAIGLPVVVSATDAKHINNRHLWWSQDYGSELGTSVALTSSAGMAD